jgi:hypothetical protein
MGHIEDPEDGKALQNLMICAEMLVAGAALTYAFPHKEYSIGGSASGFRLDAFAHAASMRDVVKDVVHVFAPTYSGAQARDRLGAGSWRLQRMQAWACRRASC